MRLSTRLMPLLAFLLAACGGRRPADLGVTAAGQLRPCPGTPNCVRSEAGTAADAAVAPFAAPGGAADFARLVSVAAAMPRAAVVTRTDSFAHLEFTSRLMRFVDDVEFRLDSAARQIHVRSASRLGRSDLGVNRKRVEELRARYDATPR